MVFNNSDLILLISARKHLTGCEEIRLDWGFRKTASITRRNEKYYVS